jgi:hypothetical protein
MIQGRSLSPPRPPASLICSDKRVGVNFQWPVFTLENTFPSGTNVPIGSLADWKKTKQLSNLHKILAQQTDWWHSERRPQSKAARMPKRDENSDHSFAKRYAEEREEDQAFEDAISGAQRDFLKAITSGQLDDAVVLRSMAHFERFLAWHQESRQLWKNGYIDDKLQLDISRQFLPEQLEAWRIDLMGDPATPDQVVAFKELAERVRDDAVFLVRHIETKLAKPQISPPDPQP